MKKEDLAKVSGGAHAYKSIGMERSYDLRREGYHGDYVMHMDNKERYFLGRKGYDAIQIGGNMSNGDGTYIIKKNKRYVDPRDVVNVFDEFSEEMAHIREIDYIQ